MERRGIEPPIFGTGIQRVAIAPCNQRRLKKTRIATYKLAVATTTKRMAPTNNKNNNKISLAGL
jgi:HD superfamily phosphohydrolase YqeK